MTVDGQPASLKDIYDLVLSTSRTLSEDIRHVQDDLTEKIDELKDKHAAEALDTATSISTLRANQSTTSLTVESLVGRVGSLERTQQASETRAQTIQDQHDRVRDWKRHSLNILALFGSAALGGAIALAGSGGIH